MKARLQPTRFLLLCCLGFLLSAPPALALRVYALGDSITHGTTTPGGYRSPLYQKLTAAGYNVDMVGSSTVFADAVLNAAGEQHHDGHSGWTIGQIDQNVLTWLGQFEAPDVILMHIGTNDFRNGVSNPGAIDQLDALITKIAIASPESHIIVTNLMERGGSPNIHIQNDFNPFVEGRVEAQAALGRKVSFLDMRAAVPLSDMPDQLHPNATGLGKMADAYFEAMKPIIGPPFRITSFEVNKSANGALDLHASMTWSSRPGRTYVIDVSDDLSEWTDLEFSTASSGSSTTREFFIPKGAPAKYFRVRTGRPSSELLTGSTVEWLVPEDDSLEATWQAIELPGKTVFVQGKGTGVGFENFPSTFDPFIETDVLEDMRFLNASIYLRYGFVVPVGRTHVSLSLGMRYDDGFIAYLNGTEIASRNAPETATWNANATASHNDLQAIAFEEIDVSEFAGLLRPGEDNVLAIQGLNTDANGSDFLIMPRLSGDFEAEPPQ